MTLSKSIINCNTSLPLPKAKQGGKRGEKKKKKSLNAAGNGYERTRNGKFRLQNHFHATSCVRTRIRELIITFYPREHETQP